MTQLSRNLDWHVVDTYVVDTLGAPFRVIVKNSACVSTCPSTGDELVRIPDLVGLVSEVVRLRVMDGRKLSGLDIKFIRKSLDIRAKKLASFLEFTPEHYSRLEAGDKVMSPQAERLFRLFAYLSTFCGEPEKLLDGIVNMDGAWEKAKPIKKSKEFGNKFVQFFIAMKIDPFHRPGEHIEYVLRRTVHPHCCDTFDSEGDWLDETPPSRTAA